MKTIVIIEPKAAVSTAVAVARRPLDTLEGKVVGFIDNSKPNFHHLADDLGQLLMERYGVARVVTHRKLSASIPAPESTLADVGQNCDLVITGSGD